MANRRRQKIFSLSRFVCISICCRCQSSVVIERLVNGKRSEETMGKSEGVECRLNVTKEYDCQLYVSVLSAFRSLCNVLCTRARKTKSTNKVRMVRRQISPTDIIFSHETYTDTQKNLMNADDSRTPFSMRPPLFAGTTIQSGIHIS